MSFIEKSVARLNQMERLDQLILDLGKSHYRYNAPPKYYSVGPQPLEHLRFHGYWQISSRVCTTETLAQGQTLIYGGSKVLHPLYSEGET